METRDLMTKDYLNYWRNELGIEIGMSKDVALEKFREWQQKKKTCQRCEADQYIELCPIQNICKEANHERDVKRNDNRRRTPEINEPKALRIELSQARERASVR